MNRFDGFSVVIAITSNKYKDPIRLLRESFSTVEFDFETGWYYSGSPAGAFKVFEPNAEDLPSSCPFSKDLVGLLAVEPWSEDTFRWIVEHLLRTGGGYAIDLKREARFGLPVKKKISLGRVVDRHGFEEGGTYLVDSEEYHNHVRSEIRRTLATIGLVPERYNSGDHPHILRGLENDDDSYKENWATFKNHADFLMCDLWGADLVGMNEWLARTLERLELTT